MKKLLSILLMLTCVIGLTACGEEKEMIRYDSNIIEAQCYGVYSIVTLDYSDEHLAEFEYYRSDDYDKLSSELNEVFASVGGLHVEGKTLINAIKSWNNSLEELGTTEIAGEYIFDEKEDELIVTIPISGSIHDGSMEFMYDEDLHITSITTNIKYSTSELMAKAGINTMIGMGTVFIILILISIIISCFGVIPKIQAAFAKKEQVKDAKKESVDNAIAGIIEREEVEDDTELIAVIAAAIAASEGASSTDGFVVRSIRKIR